MPQVIDRPAPSQGSAVMFETLNRPLPQKIKDAQEHYEKLVPGLLVQGLEGQYVVVFATGKFEVSKSYMLLEDKYEEELENEEAILEEVSPLNETLSLPYRKPGN